MAGNLMRERLVSVAGVAIIVIIIVASVEISAYFYTTYLAKRYGILFYLPHITESHATYAASFPTPTGGASAESPSTVRSDHTGPWSIPK